MRYLWIFSLFVSVVALDQWTKWIAMSELSAGQIVPIIDGFFNLTLVFNPGVAFGMFSGITSEHRAWIVGGISITALLIVITFIARHYRESTVALSSLACILGGAVGNLIDRFRLGKVVDFLDFYIREWHWPAFNVADSFIFIGVALLLLLPAPPSENLEPPA